MGWDASEGMGEGSNPVRVPSIPSPHSKLELISILHTAVGLLPGCYYSSCWPGIVGEGVSNVFGS